MSAVFVRHPCNKKKKLHDAKKAMKVDLQHVSYIISIFQLLVTVSPRVMSQSLVMLTEIGTVLWGHG